MPAVFTSLRRSVVIPAGASPVRISRSGIVRVEPVVPVGMYRVEITSPDTQIPAKFNTKTTLSVEVSAADDPYHQGPVIFQLRSK